MNFNTTTLQCAINQDFKAISKLISLGVINENQDSNGLSFLDNYSAVNDDPYDQFLKENELSKTDRFLIALASFTGINPIALKPLHNNVNFGVIEKEGKYLPSLTTAIKLASFNNSFETDYYFNEFLNAKVVQEGIVKIIAKELAEISIGDEVQIGNEYIQYFLKSGEFRPDKSSSFPAKLVKTAFSWDDLIVKNGVKKALKEVINWINYGKEILKDDNYSGKIGIGFPVLFYGPPGTGKTMAAGLIGKFTNLPVYRVDLSLITSKYVGETQKNLAALFNRAQNKNWILFFDEADALFGKRTGVKDANDKFANQEMSYILQRIEEFNGVVILATNYSDNIDEAMTRRFQSKIYFGMPDEDERLNLWERSLPNGYSLSEKVQPKLIAKHYKLTGANIRNVIKMLTVDAKSKNIKVFEPAAIQEKIMIELAKEGKSL